MLPALSLALSLSLAQVPLDSPLADESAGSSSSDSRSTSARSTKPRSIYRIAWPVDAAVIVGGTVAVIVPYALSRELITPRCPCDPREVNAFDRPAIGNRNNFLDVTSDVTVGIVWAAPLLLDALDVGLSIPLLEDSVIFAEVLAVNGALVTATKYIVQRPMPRTYAGDPALLTSPNGYRSFYSGHTSNAMAALTFTAMTLRLRHGEKWWPWVVALLVGSSVGIERVLAGRHFPTDALAGGIVGGALGILVPFFHSRGSAASDGFSLSPIRDGAQLGWTLRW
jgi:membrane-associated phospholipid phosphatase